MFLDFVWLIIGLTVFSLIFYFEFIIIKKIIKTIRKAFKPKNTITNDDATTIIDETYIRNDKTGTIRRIDNKPISDEEVPYLIEIGYQHAKEREKQFPNPKFHRTEREEELSFQFGCDHFDEIQKRINSFEECCRLASAEKNLNKKIELLEKTIVQFEKAKNWFYSTEGGTIYFQDCYENIYYSQNEWHSYIDSVKRCLKECVHERDYIIPEILKVINSNHDGILQKNIYQHLPNASKGDVQRIIRKLESEGLIAREKSKNSYLLTIKERRNIIV